MLLPKPEEVIEMSASSKRPPDGKSTDPTTLLTRACFMLHSGCSVPTLMQVSYSLDGGHHVSERTV